MVISYLAFTFDRGFHPERVRLDYSHCPTGRCFADRRREYLQLMPKEHLAELSPLPVMTLLPGMLSNEWPCSPPRSDVAFSANRDLLSETLPTKKTMLPSENGCFTSFTDVSLDIPSAAINDIIDTSGPICLREAHLACCALRGR